MITGSNTSIWSPAVIDSCLESQRGTSGSGYVGSSSAATTTTNCYPPPHHQNYSPYYSNMDYLGPTSAITHSQLNPVSKHNIINNHE